MSPDIGILSTLSFIMSTAAFFLGLFAMQAARRTAARLRDIADQLDRSSESVSVPHQVETKEQSNVPAARPMVTDVVEKDVQSLGRTVGTRTVPIPSTSDIDPLERWAAWLQELSSLRHGVVAGILGEIVRDSARLAKMFQNEVTRAAFRMNMSEVLSARLVRFKTLVGEGDDSSFERRWVEPDLVPTLDVLADFQSKAALEARGGHAPGRALAERLAATLDRLGRACMEAGWFRLDRVVPLETAFDPNLHRAVGARDAAGAVGLVLEVKRVGRAHVESGMPIHKAEVVVGR